jgi:hypothetical protein
MPDKNIKKVVIKKTDLPNPIGDTTTLEYNIRYRIISEDQNRFSHWSPISTLSVNNTNTETGFNPNDIAGTSIPHNITINKPDHVASISWTMPSLLITNPTEEEKILQAQQASIAEFDVYVQWETSSILSDWIWVGKSTGSSYSLSYPHGSGAPDHIKFRVQKVTLIKSPFNAATYLISSLNNL